MRKGDFRGRRKCLIPKSRAKKEFKKSLYEQKIRSGWRTLTYKKGLG